MMLEKDLKREVLQKFHQKPEKTAGKSYCLL